MTVCTASICVILIYLEAGAYIAIMLAVLGVPQMLTYYLERRDRRRDRTESRTEAERRHQESRAEEERRHRENLAEGERNRAESERRHQETLTLLSGVVTSLATLTAGIVNSQQPAPPTPDQSEAIANLQQAVTELTSQVAQLNERIQNGNGAGQSDTQPND